MIRDMIILLIVSAACYIPLIAIKRVPRAMGIVMICAYGAYTAYLVLLR